MPTYTHKRKDYRITAIPLKYAVKLSNGDEGEVGDFFVHDEEGEQYIMKREKMERNFDDIMKVNIHITDSITPNTLITQVVGSGETFTINPARYTLINSD